MGTNQLLRRKVRLHCDAVHISSYARPRAPERSVGYCNRQAPDTTPPRSCPAAAQCRSASAEPCRPRDTAWLLSAHDCLSGAARGAGDHTGGAQRWSGRSGALAGTCRSARPTRSGRRDSWQNPTESRGNGTDSQALILGRGAVASARRNVRGEEKERYLAHSNAKTAC